MDLLDVLPDEMVLSILEKLQDAKSLCSSMAACKRFRSIAPQVDQIFLPIPRRKSEIHRNSFVTRALMKPFQFLSKLFKSKTEQNDLDFYSYYIPNEIFKSFEQIRVLHLMLPCNGKQGGSTTFLKWKAEFGRELHSCVILGAKSWSEKPIGSGQGSRVMGDDELKVRIVWTVSCLIAASARHYLIRDAVRGLRGIESVVVTDESEQGRLCMNREQIAEMRGYKEEEVEENRRSRVPALRMKMWYLERMELPGYGKVVEGATLVVIRPATAGAEKGDADMVAGAFGGGGEVGEAVRKLMVAKKCYVLEMNSF